MQPTDRPEFLRVLNGLAMLKPGQSKLTPEALDLWWSAMANWSLQDFKSAAAHLAKSVEFMPSPYHFEQLRKAGRPTAAEAWSSALDYVRKGYVLWNGGGVSPIRGPVPPQDPVTQRAVAALGGYEAIALCHTDKLHFLERRFAEHFEDLQDAEDVRNDVPQITSQAPNRVQLKGPAPLTAALEDLSKAVGQ